MLIMTGYQNLTVAIFLIYLDELLMSLRSINGITVSCTLAQT